MKWQSSYLPVAADDSFTDDRPRPFERTRAITPHTIFFIALLLLTNTLTALLVEYRPWLVPLHRDFNAAGLSTPSHPYRTSVVLNRRRKLQLTMATAITDELPPDYTRFRWWTEWGLSHPNSTDLDSADHLWDSTQPSHGLIAVDRTWAEEHRWPVSMFQPKDVAGESKGVYMLEAYHLMHCLTIVRRSFQEARRGQPLTYLASHSIHCFDAIRQSILCHADNTPLYTFGENMAGEGQLRKCRSWDALRDYATENTACYRDPEGTNHSWSLEDHFGHCEEGHVFDDGKDGFT